VSGDIAYSMALAAGPCTARGDLDCPCTTLAGLACPQSPAVFGLSLRNPSVPIRLRDQVPSADARSVTYLDVPANVAGFRPVLTL